MKDSSTLTDSAKPRAVCRHYPADSMDRSHVLMGRWTTATLRMTCLTGGRTPCSAAAGIPGRRATSLSPICGARAAPMKASPGTRWSGARQTAAAQPGTARGTTRPAQRPPATLVFPTHGPREASGGEVASTIPCGARWGAIVSRYSATQSLLKCSIIDIYQSSGYCGRRQPIDRTSFASRGSASRSVQGEQQADSDRRHPCPDRSPYPWCFPWQKCAERGKGH